MRTINKFIAVMLAILIAVCIVPMTANEAKAVNSTASESTITAEIIRFGGADRIETAKLIADEGWDNADTVFLANGYTYADALSGAPLAYAYDAPILLIDGKTVSTSVTTELIKLGIKNVYLLGGDAAINSDVESSLKSIGYDVTRIWGATRFETAIEIAKALIDKSGETDEAFIASGVNYPDALSASPIAAIKGSPILYSPSNGELDSGTKDFLKNNSISTAYILGGTSAVGATVSDTLTGAGVGATRRIGGADRYETALLIAKNFNSVFTSNDVSFATGKNFPDALAGGVFAAKKGIPVLLTDNVITNAALRNYIDEKDPEKAYVFGGTVVVNDEIVEEYLPTKTEPTTTTTTAATTSTATTTTTEATATTTTATAELTTTTESSTTTTTSTTTTVNTTQSTTTTAKGTTTTVTGSFAQGDTFFVLNTSTLCFHLDANCQAVKKLALENRRDINSTIESVKANGYWACGYCAKAYKD